ncbi:MAG: protoporphyrinogen oxidase [Bacteroidales bacterium]
MDPEPFDVIVIGGGIAGLAAAYELHTRGLRFRLLERAPRPGGVILTDRIGGFTVDAGPDALLIQKPAAVDLCRQVGLGARLMPTKRPRTAYIIRDGRLHPLPESSVLGIPRDVRALAATRLFSIPGKMRMAAELLVPAARVNGDESIGSFIGRRFGREAVTYLAEPLLAGIHAGDVNRLSMHGLFPRFVAAERKYGSVLRAFRQLRQPAARSGDGAFYSLPDGLVELVDALVAALPSDTVRLDSPVGAVTRDADGFVVQAPGGSVRAPSVIVATPAYVAGDLLQAVDAGLADLCRQVEYASSATVAFGYRRDQIAHALLGSGFVVPRVEKTTIMAASWVSSKWPERAPEGHVLLRAFIGGARDPGAMARSDEDLIEAAERELGRIIGISGAPEFVRLYRWNRANAQHDVGHLARMAAIDNRLRQVPGLYVTGSGFRGVGIPDCIADARATAAHAAERLSGR